MVWCCSARRRAIVFSFPTTTSRTYELQLVLAKSPLTCFPECLICARHAKWTGSAPAAFSISPFLPRKRRLPQSLASVANRPCSRDLRMNWVQRCWKLVRERRVSPERSSRRSVELDL